MHYQILKRLSLLALIVLCLPSCKKKEDPPLPPSLRQEFNCYINGEYFTMKPSGPCNQLKTLYVNDSGSVGNNPAGYLIVRGTDCETRNTLTLIMDSVFKRGSYIFPEDDYNTYFVDWWAALQDTVEYNPIEDFKYYAVDGHVKITELTPQSYRDATLPDGQPYQQRTDGWIEGTFEITLINNISLDSNNTEHDTLKITNGKFAAIL